MRNVINQFSFEGYELKYIWKISPLSIFIDILFYFIQIWKIFLIYRSHDKYNKNLLVAGDYFSCGDLSILNYIYKCICFLEALMKVPQVASNKGWVKYRGKIGQLMFQHFDFELFWLSGKLERRRNKTILEGTTFAPTFFNILEGVILLESIIEIVNKNNQNQFKCGKISIVK